MSAIRITRKGILGIDQRPEHSNIYLLETGENVFSADLVNSGNRVKLRICNDSDFSKTSKDTKGRANKIGTLQKKIVSAKNVY